MTTLRVLEDATVLEYGYPDLMRYHGPGFPGGVAHAFKVLERALPLLAEGDPPQRRAIGIRTCFRGPGARDAFEMVTRALTEDRYVIDAALERPERGRLLERYVFALTHRDRTVVLTIRDDGFVVEEFIDLARKEGRGPEEEARLTVLKAEMAQRLLARPAEEVYDAQVLAD